MVGLVSWVNGVDKGDIVWCVLVVLMNGGISAAIQTVKPMHQWMMVGGGTSSSTSDGRSMYSPVGGESAKSVELPLPSSYRGAPPLCLSRSPSMARSVDRVIVEVVLVGDCEAGILGNLGSDS
ncbi:hypothetical protein Tco_1368936 [Tanacetum coccineum]